MQLYTVTDDVVGECFNHILPDKIEEKARIIAPKGWKFFFKKHNDGTIVLASIKDNHEPGDKFLGSTKIVKTYGDVDKNNYNVRKEIILLVNETFNKVKEPEC